jgi:hypothetical protein
MSLTEVKLSNLVQKQVKYKLQSYLGVFSSLMATQVLAMIFSAGGYGSSTTGTGGVDISVHLYAGNLIIIFTLVWAFASAIQLTTKGYRYEDFTFVTNRLSSNLSNIIFLLAMCFIGGLTVMMSSTFLRLIGLFIFQDNVIGFLVPLDEWMIGVLSTSLYLFLIASIGYLVGMLGQIHKIFYFIIIGLSLFILYQGLDILSKIYVFFAEESSLFIFAAKVFSVSAILLLAAVLISNRLEVSK